jgi:putative membrane protein
MFLEIIIAILIGCIFGIFTGLIPGIHINLVSLLALSFLSYLLEITSPLTISIFIISMAITHTFLDTIPSIFLGAPESDTALSVLPGHKMLLQGRGYEAVMLTLIGSFFSLILTILLIPLIGNIIQLIYPYFEKIMGIILILSSTFLILREKVSKRWALIIFLLSGVLGIATLNLPNLKNSLFPLLSGLFGTSMLVISLSEKVKIPKQKISFPEIRKKELSKTIGSSLIAGGLCSFLPGLGPAQAAIIGSSFYKKITGQNFLILIGGLNTINMVLSFLALYLFNKARNGAIVVVSKIIQELTLNNLILFLGVSLVAGGIAVFLTIKITKIFSKLISKINYHKLVLSIIIFIAVMVFFISSKFIGLLVLVVSTFTGILPAKLGIGRNHLMGCLLVPVILYFLL